MRPLRLVLLTLATMMLGACQSASPTAEESAPAPMAEAPEEAAPETAAPTEAPQISFGDGQANRIVVEGATRDGATLTFKEVLIDGNGWLVLHPFENGKPVGARYVGATYLESGENLDVAVQLETEPASGEFFLVMLHLDVNENQEFDFVFVDERNVLDKAVFEGMTMIAHPFAAP